WATNGRATTMGPVIELSRGLTAKFSDIEIEYPTGKMCAIGVGFPRGGWDLSNVTKLSIVRRPAIARERVTTPENARGARAASEGGDAGGGRSQER
ncbi:MAG: hypothetical protein JXB46_07660, partial [Candidatus Eisenbacteria bacterium]|nr:hypothetical protein [Candidatus Eisenbacteria bacterium]